MSHRIIKTMKHKITILISSILIIFITGFISGRLIKPFRSKDVSKTEILLDKVDLQQQQKKITESYIDSANKEMFNYSIRYFHTTPNLLPNHYTDINGDIVIFNKENFFRYYSLYKISNHLSNAKSSIINNLILEQKDTI